MSLAHQLLPVAYTTYEEPRSSYEYSASVATQDYNNHVSVKSIDPALYRSQPIAQYAYAPSYIRSAPIAYAQYAQAPAYVQYAQAPALINAAPALIKAAPIEIKAAKIEQTPILKAEPAITHDVRFDAPIAAQYAYPAPAYLRADQYLQQPIIAPATYAIKQEPIALYNAPQPELTPVLQPIIKTQEPIVKHYVPAPLIAAHPQPFIAGKNADILFYNFFNVGLSLIYIQTS